ncbi:MAG: hypothetical protein WC241_01690 [Candidatus Paceibacterota bacterium]|jgi:hypothetical protein
MKRGWWHIEATIPLNDTDRDHIAKLVAEGYTDGEIQQGEVQHDPR